MSASLCTYPLDLIRTVIGVKVQDAAEAKPTIMSTGRELFAKEGIRGLYRGLNASLWVSHTQTNLTLLTRFLFLGYHSICWIENGGIRYFEDLVQN